MLFDILRTAFFVISVNLLNDSVIKGIETRLVKKKKNKEYVSSSRYYLRYFGSSFWSIMAAVDVW